MTSLLHINTEKAFFEEYSSASNSLVINQSFFSKRKLKKNRLFLKNKGEKNVSGLC